MKDIIIACALVVLTFGAGWLVGLLITEWVSP